MYKWIESSFRFASSATLYSSLHRFSFVTFKVNARVDRVSINWSNSTIFTRSHAHTYTRSFARSLSFFLFFVRFLHSNAAHAVWTGSRTKFIQCGRFLFDLLAIQGIYGRGLACQCCDNTDSKLEYTFQG